MAGQSTPQVKAVIANVVNQNTGPEVTPAEGEKIAAKTLKAMASDPVVANATGQERWYQSGVGLFSQGGILWCLGAIITQVWTHGDAFSTYDVDLMVTALGGIVAFGGVLYRRFVPGLRPFFWRWSQG